ncbi:hypothetical protein [Eudoraea sp.]|uniref:hypothetical protein n=1 Tax=Eudoraea sp. TaxID=1979955 RepID=UPI003C760CC9
MKANYYLFLLIILGFFFSSVVNAQEVNPDKVEIFSSEEKDNLQIWFHEEVEKMNLTEEEMSQYSSIITYYISKISRLDDKDKGYSEERFKKELNSLLKKQDKELEELLNPEQYKIHQEVYGEFLRSAYRRWGITNP